MKAVVSVARENEAVRIRRYGEAPQRALLSMSHDKIHDKTIQNMDTSGAEAPRRLKPALQSCAWGSKG